MQILNVNSLTLPTAEIVSLKKTHCPELFAAPIDLICPPSHIQLPIPEWHPSNVMGLTPTNRKHALYSNLCIRYKANALNAFAAFIIKTTKYSF